jgi:KUP system potassium uptake protein
MTANPDVVPHALLHSIKHYKSLHERVVLLTITTLDVPHVPVAQRVAVESIDARFHKVRGFFGFMDEPDVPALLEWCAEQGLRLDPMDTSFFLGRESLIPTIGAAMALWREKLFVAMHRNAGSMANYLNLPPNRVVELGSQVAL